METGCEPSLLLQRPARFHRVCPLLQPNARGVWLCSVDTPQVRPFWGRATGFFALIFLFCYLLGTSSAWTFLRLRGYPIRYAQAVWPGAWSQFPKIQSRFFVQKANRALAANDVGEAIMALSLAYQLDSQNYALGLAFAKLTQAGQPAVSDNVYARLARDHPERRGEIYAVWYDGLLWRADFSAIVDLTRDALAVDLEHRGAWLNALLFALRREPDPGRLRRLVDDPKLAAVRPVFELELQTETGGASARAALLETRTGAGTLPFLNYYRPQRLIEIGFPRDALELLKKQSNALPPRDIFSLQVEADAALGWTTIRRNEFNAQFGEIDHAAVSDLLAAQLIRHPDPELFRDSFAAFQRRPVLPADLAYRTWAGWLCAAGANGDFESLRIAGAAMKKISSSEFRALPMLEGFFRGESASARIESYLPAVQPLPLDVTYALLERYYRPRRPSPKT
jgi:hypothetical protein